MDNWSNSYDPYHVPRRGRGQPILYLDFDGVLHTQDCYVVPRQGPFVNPPHRLFEHERVLLQCLEAHPGVCIVLSTSWVRVKGYSYALKRLSPLLQSKVIGATYHSSMDPHSFEVLPRGLQVLQDVHRRQPSWWMALDDDVWAWPQAYLQNLIATDGDRGLGDACTVNELTKRLSNRNGV
jgi:hypothetical protein